MTRENGKQAEREKVRKLGPTKGGRYQARLGEGRKGRGGQKGSRNEGEDNDEGYTVKGEGGREPTDIFS